MYNDYGYGCSGWSVLPGALGMLLWLLFLLVIVGLIWRGRGMGRYRDRRWMDWMEQGGRSMAALDLLKERYVKGEIDKQEFEEKRRDLTTN